MPIMVIAVFGLRFWAMVELPILPMWKASATSPISVRIRKMMLVPNFSTVAASAPSVVQ